MANILVIEDNPSNLRLAATVLGYAGHRVLTAACAEEGIEIARRERPDAILMDMQMPGMNGLEATRVLKADAATAAIPVLALTAYAMKGDAQLILAAGCDAYLAKPYGHSELSTAVAQLLGAKDRLHS